MDLVLALEWVRDNIAEFGGDVSRVMIFGQSGGGAKCATLPEALEKGAPFLKSEKVSLPVAEVIANYRKWNPTYSASDVFFAVTTDSRSWRGEVIEAEHRAVDPLAEPHTWVYQLNWTSGVDHGKWDAPHTLDIPLAFDNCALAPGMVGASEDDQRRAQQMSDVVCATFVAFAKTGNPNNVRLPKWPSFALASRPTMIFDLPPRVEDDPRGRERKYLGQVEYVQPGT